MTRTYRDVHDFECYYIWKEGKFVKRMGRLFPYSSAWFMHRFREGADVDIISEFQYVFNTWRISKEVIKTYTASSRSRDKYSSELTRTRREGKYVSGM